MEVPILFTSSSDLLFLQQVPHCPQSRSFETVTLKLPKHRPEHGVLFPAVALGTGEGTLPEVESQQQISGKHVKYNLTSTA